MKRKTIQHPSSHQIFATKALINLGVLALVILSLPGFGQNPPGADSGATGDGQCSTGLAAKSEEAAEAPKESPPMNVLPMVTHFFGRHQGKSAMAVEFRFVPNTPGQPRQVNIVWRYAALLSSRVITSFRVESMTYNAKENSFTATFDSGQGSLYFVQGDWGIYRHPRVVGGSLSLYGCAATGNW